MDNYIISWILFVIDSLPEVVSFTIPSVVYDGIDNMTALLGYFMPYDYYEPLILFILSLTAFRIVYAIYMRIKK